MIHINSGNGTLGRLIKDSTIAENLNQTVRNLKKSSSGLNENMNAAKENFLFRGYYKRREKAAEKVKADTIEKELERQKEINKGKK
jgi:phospholipid/cholesterol/gamma-HCH transport system substrate-binding protein